MANLEHLDILKRKSVKEWNKWREINPHLDIDLSDADLSGMKLKGIDFRPSIIVDKPGDVNLERAKLKGVKLNNANLISANLYEADFRNADLRDATLSGANLIKSDFRDADLRGVHIFNTYLNNAKFNNSKLNKAYFRECDFTWADLSNVDLSNADMSKTNLFNTNLAGANLSEADLSRAHFVKTHFDNRTNLNGARVYGVSAWDNEHIELNKQQQNLIITEEGNPVVTVDNLEVAQFIYLLLNNEKIRDVLDTIGMKGVLILGRFTEKRKLVLDAIRDKLRELNFVPILFDFEKPSQRDFTETIKILAGLSRFIIADITNPKSSPLELQATMPDYMIPFVPIIHNSEIPFSMFTDLRQKYGSWVLDVLEYSSTEKLIDVLQQAVIIPALEKENELLTKKTGAITIRHVEDYKKRI